MVRMRDLVSTSGRRWRESRAMQLWKVVAGILSGFGLAALLQQALDFNWHGLLSPVMRIWADKVRPPIAWIFDRAVTWPLDALFGFHIVVPVLVRDYIAVGVFFAASMARANNARLSSLKTVGPLLATVAFWPLYLFVFAILAAIPYEEDAEVRAIAVLMSSRATARLAVLPMVYVALLLILNALSSLV